MPESKVLRPGGSPPQTLRPDSELAWRWLGWLGVLLTVVGAGDLALAWYPPGFGRPAWEFATIAASFSGLPLVTMGLAALLGSAAARGIRWMVRLVSWLCIVAGLLVLAAFVLFLTDVPIALRGSPAEVMVGVKKAIAKTSLLGVSFGSAYLVAGFAGLRHARLRR